MSRCMLIPYSNHDTDVMQGMRAERAARRLWGASGSGAV